MILALDPSVGTGTGWVVWDGKIMDYGCDKFKSKEKNSSRKKIDLQYQYNKYIINLWSKYNIDTIYSEFPHGSQNANAAWSMSMCTSIITSVAQTVSCNLEYCLESHWKKYLFGKSKGIKKTQTQAKMYNMYDLPEIKTKYVKEGVCDALGVLTFFLAKNK